MDVSREGIVYVAYQKGPDGKRNIIQMGSSALGDNQQQWSTNDLEAFEVAYVCKKSKFFITSHPREILVNTDNSSKVGIFKKKITDIENP